MRIGEEEDAGEITLFVNVVSKKINVLSYFNFSLIKFSPFKNPEFWS
jgi:hypothetical protein